MTLGFIVDGPSDKIVVESDSFSRWLDDRGMRRRDPVVVVGGQMRGGGIGGLSRLLRKQGGDIDYVVQLTDLDPDASVPCISARRAFVESPEVDLVVVAKKAIESWFLADSVAMRDWTRDRGYFEMEPEKTARMPWERLKEIGVSLGRGPGSKVSFSKRIVRRHGFSITGAAAHPKCPSAQYFVERLGALGEAR